MIAWAIEVMNVTDILIRNVAEADLRRIDEKAEHLGLSRPEYLRRQIAQDAARMTPDAPPSVAAFQRLASLTRDVLDEDVMREAWS